MMDRCANPACAKPLVYLREGRVFAFDVAAQTDGIGFKKTRHLEHFWLCGACARSMTIVQHEGAVEVSRKAERAEPLRYAAIG
jgi:hypothetical protein